MEQNSSLKSKTLKGLFWSFTELLANYGIQFIIQIVLARLLLPEYFGIIGMILVLIAISNSLVDCGFSQALIRDQDVSQEDYSTVFHFNLIISILLYIILFISAPSFSVFFGVSQLVEIIRVLSLVLIINSLSITQKVKLTKILDFKTLTKVNIIAAFSSGSISIAMAFAGFGVWSLVANMLALQFVQTLLLWIFNRWIPSIVFSIQSFKKYFGFGYKLLLSGLIDSIYNNLYFLIIGKLYSATQLGYYTNAVRIRDMASQSIVAAVQRVTYPVLSSTQEDEKRLKSVFRNMIKTTGFVNFPLMIGGAVVATPLFQLLFGEKWLPSVLYFQLLCIAGMLYPIHALNLNILKVKGRSDLFLLLEIIKKIVVTILIALSLFFNLGIIGLICAAVFSSFISLFINMFYSAKEISYSSKEQIRDLMPIFLVSFLMGGIVYFSGFLLQFGVFMNLISQIFFGIVLYVTLSKILKVQELNILIEIILPFIRKIKTIGWKL